MKMHCCSNPFTGFMIKHTHRQIHTCMHTHSLVLTASQEVLIVLHQVWGLHQGVAAAERRLQLIPLWCSTQNKHRNQFRKHISKNQMYSTVSYWAIMDSVPTCLAAFPFLLPHVDWPKHTSVYTHELIKAQSYQSNPKSFCPLSFNKVSHGIMCSNVACGLQNLIL